jgi:hypothetical protein
MKAIIHPQIIYRWFRMYRRRGESFNQSIVRALYLARNIY